MVSTWGFLVLAMFVITGIGGESFDIDVKKESFRCYEGLLSVFTPTCAHYEDKFVIQLIAMKYGFLPHHKNCSNETRGCEYDVSPGHFDIAIQDMLGRQQSDPYRFPTSEPQQSQECPAANYSSTVSYMIACYNCIKASKMKDICSDITPVSDDEIYFWNEGFPNEGAQIDRDTCDCLLEVNSDILEVVTFYKKLDCSQNLTLKYASSNTSDLFVWNCSQIVSKQESTTLRDMSNQNLSLTWMNNFDGENRTGKYWIKLKAVNGTIRLKCPMHDRIPDTTPTSDIGETTQIHADVHENSTADVDKKVSDWFKLKEVADDNEKWIQFEMNPLYMMENIVEKGEIACHKPTIDPVNINNNKDDTADNPFNLTIVIAAGSGGAVVLLIVIIIVVVVVRRQNANIEKIIEQRMSEMNTKQDNDKRNPNTKNGRSSSSTRPRHDFEEYERRSREEIDKRDQMKMKQRGKEPRQNFVENERTPRETNYTKDHSRSKQRRKNSRQDLLENDHISKEPDYTNLKISSKQQGRDLRQGFVENERNLRDRDEKSNQIRRHRQGKESQQDFIENEHHSEESNYTKVKIRRKQQDRELRQSLEENERRSRETDCKDDQTWRNRKGRESPQDFMENERQPNEPNYTKVKIRSNQRGKELRQDSLEDERISLQTNDRNGRTRSNRQGRESQDSMENERQLKESNYTKVKIKKNPKGTESRQVFVEIERGSEETNDGIGQIGSNRQGRKPRHDFEEFERRSRETNDTYDHIIDNQQKRKLRQDFLENERRSRESNDIKDQIKSYTPSRRMYLP